MRDTAPLRGQPTPSCCRDKIGWCLSFTRQPGACLPGRAPCGTPPPPFPGQEAPSRCKYNSDGTNFPALSRTARMPLMTLPLSLAAWVLAPLVERWVRGKRTATAAMESLVFVALGGMGWCTSSLTAWCWRGWARGERRMTDVSQEPLIELARHFYPAGFPVEKDDPSESVPAHQRHPSTPGSWRNGMRLSPGPIGSPCSARGCPSRPPSSARPLPRRPRDGTPCS